MWERAIFGILKYPLQIPPSHGAGWGVDSVWSVASNPTSTSLLSHMDVTQRATSWGVGGVHEMR